MHRSTAKSHGADPDLVDNSTEDSNSEDYTDMSTEDSDQGPMSEDDPNDFQYHDGTANKHVLSRASQPTNKVTKSMQDILKEMVRQRRLLDEHEMFLTYVAEDVDNTYANNTAVELFDDPTEDLKLFASFLHFYSPGAYEHIREKYNTPLPNIKVLATWCQNDQFQAGFTKQAFDILEKRHTENGKRLICSLVGNEFQLFVHESFVTVDVGAGPLNSAEVDENEGRNAYVILLVSLEENWKIPLCYFLSCTETKANLIKMCLHRTYEVGVDVVSITTTTKIAQNLGCELKDYKKLKTTFKHPASGVPVAAFMDPTLSLRSLYHTISSKKEIFNEKKQKISTQFIEQLKKILADKSFQFDFTKGMLDLRNILAKIDLVSELMVPSLAAALEICKNRLKLPKFLNAGPTIEYLTMINTLYHILYSRAGQSGFKQPISKDNAKEILEFLEEAKKYVASVSYSGTGRATQLGVQDPNFLAEGFKGLLISIETVKHLYTTLVENGALETLPTYKLSWDQMDEFFGVILKHNPRQGGGEFPPIYKRFFEDLKSTLTDRVQIESYGITNYEKPLEIIKKSSGKRAFDESYSVVKEKRRKTEDDKRADTNVSKFAKLLDTERDKEDRQHMVGYVAGWIAIQLAQSLRCEGCIDNLLTNKKLWFHKYITMKELKGVCLPSEELFRICWECERSVRGQTKLDLASQRRLMSRALRISETSHRNHQVHLTKAVVAKYVTLRVDLDETRNPEICGACGGEVEMNPFLFDFSCFMHDYGDDDSM